MDHSPDSWDLHDRTGNVWEWCWDWYADYSGTSNDPVGPQSGSFRVLRGGSWNGDPNSARMADRSGSTPDDYDYDYKLVLRLVRSIQPGATP